MGVHSDDDVEYSVGYSRRTRIKHYSEETQGLTLKDYMRLNDQSGCTCTSFHLSDHRSGWSRGILCLEIHEEQEEQDTRYREP